MEHMVYRSPKEGVNDLLFQYYSHILRDDEVSARNTWNKIGVASKREDEHKLRLLREELYS